MTTPHGAHGFGDDDGDFSSDPHFFGTGGGADMADLDFLVADHHSDDDSADLDFLVADHQSSQDSEFDAPEAYAPVEDPTDSEIDLDALCPPTQQETKELEPRLFTVTNPAGTVSVSALMGGAIREVELSEKVTDMTESELEDEILVLAELARLKAQSAQYTFMLENVPETHSEYSSQLRDFIEQHLDLPTPEQAAAAQAEVFAKRYTHDDG